MATGNLVALDADSSLGAVFANSALSRASWIRLVAWSASAAVLRGVEPKWAQVARWPGPAIAAVAHATGQVVAAHRHGVAGAIRGQLTGTGALGIAREAAGTRAASLCCVKVWRADAAVGALPAVRASARATSADVAADALRVVGAVGDGAQGRALGVATKAGSARVAVRRCAVAHRACLAARSGPVEDASTGTVGAEAVGRGRSIVAICRGRAQRDAVGVLATEARRAGTAISRGGKLARARGARRTGPRIATLARAAGERRASHMCSAIVAVGGDAALAKAVRIPLESSNALRAIARGIDVGWACLAGGTSPRVATRALAATRRRAIDGRRSSIAVGRVRARHCAKRIVLAAVGARTAIEGRVEDGVAR